MAKQSRHFTEYPTMFQNALDAFIENPNLGEWSYPLGEKRNAWTRRTQFYRFMERIRDAYKEAEDVERRQTGLDKLYMLVNNLTATVRCDKYNGVWSLVVRDPGGSDIMHFETAEERLFIDAAKQKMQEQRLQEDEETFERISRGSPSDPYEEMFGKPPIEK